MLEKRLSNLIVEGLLYGLGIMFIISLFILPLIMIKQEVDKQNAVKYHIIDISGRDYYCDDYTNNNNVIEFTDYEGKFITIYKVKTIIKNK
jgi:hypothetical protein